MHIAMLTDEACDGDLHKLKLHLNYYGILKELVFVCLLVGLMTMRQFGTYLEAHLAAHSFSLS